MIIKKNKVNRVYLKHHNTCDAYLVFYNLIIFPLYLSIRTQEKQITHGDKVNIQTIHVHLFRNNLNPYMLKKCIVVKRRLIYSLALNVNFFGVPSVRSSNIEPDCKTITFVWSQGHLWDRYTLGDRCEGRRGVQLPTIPVLS